MIIRRGDFLYSYFRNFLTDSGFFCRYPKTDCQMVVGGLWNLVAYSYVFITIFLFSLGFMDGLTSFVKYGFEGMEAQAHSVKALLELLSIDELSLVTLMVISPGVGMGLVLGTILFPTVTSMLIVVLFFVCAGAVYDRRNSLSYVSDFGVVQLVVSRYQSFKEKRCGLVEFVD